MKFAFDLISDLHVDSAPGPFNWASQQTSLYCVVAGDIARDRTTVLDTIRHLAQLYMGVFIIDGNEEHRDYYDDVGASYADLVAQLKEIPGVVYLQNNVVVIDGVAFIATNGWWCYNFDHEIDFDQSLCWFMDYTDTALHEALGLLDRAYHDAAYLVSSVKRLQVYPDIKAIVMLTHTLPTPDLVYHDIDMAGNYRFNCLGNQHMMEALNVDRENKIKAWCFGHYHKAIDRDIGNVRFVSNPRGRYGSPWYQPFYYPVRVEIDV